MEKPRRDVKKRRLKKYFFYRKKSVLRYFPYATFHTLLSIRYFDTHSRWSETYRMKREDQAERPSGSAARAYAKVGLSRRKTAEFHGLIVEKAKKALEKGELNREDFALIHAACDVIKERNAVCGDRSPRKQEGSPKETTVFEVRTLTEDECT